MEIPQSKAQASLGSAKATALPLQVVRDQEYKPRAAPKPAAQADSTAPRMEQTRPFERAAHAAQGCCRKLDCQCPRWLCGHFGYRQGGSLTAARNQWGYTAAAAVGGIARGRRRSCWRRRRHRGPGGNVVAAGRGAAFVNGQFVGGKAWTAVNGAYTRWARSRRAGMDVTPAPGGRANRHSRPRPGPRGAGARPAATAVAAAKELTTTTAGT